MVPRRWPSANPRIVFGAPPPPSKIGSSVELHDYLRILRRRWPLIVVVTLLALIVAALLTFRATPLYTSTARVFVSTSPSNADAAYQGSLFSQQRVASYADLVNGLELTERVVNKLGLDKSAEDLADNVTATVVPDTVLLSISVTDPSPKGAQRINEAMVTELSRFVEELETPPGAKRALVKTTLIDPARLPESPSSPNPVRNLGLALVLGLLAGFGIAVLREILDTSIKSTEVAEEVTGAPVLGGIAFDHDIVKEPLITTLPSHSARAEAFRVLRTNLQFLDVDNVSKAFVVTSAMPGEGKSSTAANVAIAMAQGGQRVLLVDADLRRPQMAHRMGLEPSVGLTTLLLGKVELDEAVQHHSASGLSVITSGATPPNPAELLQSRAMSDLLKQLRARFDIVIIDSPPLLPVTDAALLSSITDGAIVVVNFGETTRDELSGAVARLAGVGATPLGLVLNRIPNKRGGYSYGYGYGYAPDEPQQPDGRRAKRSAKLEREQAKSVLKSSRHRQPLREPLDDVDQA